jgi:hypothetical protein
MRLLKGWRPLALGTLFLAAALGETGCAGVPPGRYVAAADPGSRYRFQFVRDRETGQWVHREFEIRVGLERQLPPLRVASEIGNSFSVQLFRPGSVGSGGIFSAIPAEEGGYRIWRGADVVGPDDLRGRVAYGVSVAFPDPGHETQHDPLELFQLPPLGDAAPGEWSPWTTAGVLRAGAFGWWEEANGVQPTPQPPPAHPFEFRWRLVFAEIPGRIP